MLEQGVLDIARVHVEPTADDQILLAVDDEQVALLVEVADVPGGQPSVVERLFGRLRRPPIATHHRGGAAADLADLTGSDLAALCVDDQQLGPRDRYSHRSGLHSSG